MEGRYCSRKLSWFSPRIFLVVILRMVLTLWLSPREKYARRDFGMRQ